MPDGIKISPERVADIRRRVELAKTYFKKTFKERYEVALSYYEGDFYGDMVRDPEAPCVGVPYTKVLIDTRHRAITNAPREIYLKPISQDAATFADTASHAIRYMLREAMAEDEARRAHLDKETTGVAIVHTGWLYKTKRFTIHDGRVPQPGEESDTTPDQYSGTGSQFGLTQVAGTPVSPIREAVVGSADPDQVEQSSTVALPLVEVDPEAVVGDLDRSAILAGSALRTPEVVELPIEDRFFVQRIDLKDFFISPEATDVQNALFCGYSCWEPLEAVKSNPFYKNTKSLKGSAGNTESFWDDKWKRDWEKDEQIPCDLKRVRLHHYYEKIADYVLHVVLADESKEPLYIGKLNWQARQYPFVISRSLGSNEKFYRQPLPVTLKHQQDELNEIRSELSLHGRMSSPAYQTQGTLDPQQRAVFESHAPLRLIEKINSPIAPIQPAQIDPTIFAREQALLADMERLAGVSAYEISNAPTKRTNIPEVAQIAGSPSSRREGDVNDYNTFVAEIAKHCLWWMQQNSSFTRGLPIYDMSYDVKGFFDFTPEQIQGRWFVEVYAAPSANPSRLDDTEQTGFLLQSLTPYAQAGLVNIQPLLRELVRGVGVRNVDEIVPPAPPPGMMPGGQPPLPPGLPGAPENQLPLDAEGIPGLDPVLADFLSQAQSVV